MKPTENILIIGLYKNQARTDQNNRRFADPYAPWQRGTNENTNGLLRHYFPNGINWWGVTEKQLAWAVERLNN